MTNSPEHSTLSTSSRRGVVLAVALAWALSTVAIPPAQAQTFTVLHTFAGPDGANPYAGVTLDARGDLYGTTSGGGTRSGTIYELKRSGSGYTYNLLHSFDGADGTAPCGGVAFGTDAILYGTTSDGGIGFGNVFEVYPPATVCKAVLCSWTETSLYAFQAYGDGANPQYGQVAFDGEGNIFGTTRNYGANYYGMVYQLSSSDQGWRENILYNFRGVASGDGAYPDHNVIFDSSGNLYGTTSLGGVYGGEYGGGTVFELTPSGSGWAESVVMSFPPPGSNVGDYLQAGLIIDHAGNLYGATTDGRNGVGSGSVFELSPSSNGWQLTVLYAFDTPCCGGPIGNLVMDGSGNLYGTTFGGGAFGYGSVFKLTLNTMTSESVRRAAPPNTAATAIRSQSG